MKVPWEPILISEKWRQRIFSALCADGSVLRTSMHCFRLRGIGTEPPFSKSWIRHCINLGWACIMNCFVLPCFPVFAVLLSLYLVTFLMLFSLVCHFFLSSWCMLELKLAIYHRTAKSLSSQASFVDVYSMGWKITDLGIYSSTESMWIHKARQVFMSSCAWTIFLI